MKFFSSNSKLGVVMSIYGQPDRIFGLRISPMSSHGSNAYYLSISDYTDSDSIICQRIVDINDGSIMTAENDLGTMDMLVERLDRLEKDFNNPNSPTILRLLNGRFVELRREKD